MTGLETRFAHLTSSALPSRSADAISAAMRRSHLARAFLLDAAEPLLLLRQLLLRAVHFFLGAPEPLLRVAQLGRIGRVLPLLDLRFVLIDAPLVAFQLLVLRIELRIPGCRLALVVHHLPHLAQEPAVADDVFLAPCLNHR